MTRKDYVLIASALSSAKPSFELFTTNTAAFEADLNQWTKDVQIIAAQLKADNPRFDRDRFIKACAE